MVDEPADGEPFEAEQLERAADWRIRKVGEDPADRESAAAAKLLQTLATEVRRLRGSPCHGEYVAILNWLDEFDVAEEFAQRADEYRAGIGTVHAPADGEAYLRALIRLAKEVVGA